MRIAITSEGQTLDSWIDQRFGRCAYFLIVETDDLSYETIPNQNAQLGGGAGIKSAQLLVDKKVTHVLTGTCGPNAYQALASAGISVIAGCSGQVMDVIKYFKNGRFITSEGPNVSDHYGIRGGYSQPAGSAMGTPIAYIAGIGRSMEWGRGMGQGRGMGMGRGMGVAAGFSQNANLQNEKVNSENELESLKKQLVQISKRIAQIESEKAR